MENEKWEDCILVWGESKSRKKKDVFAAVLEAALASFGSGKG